MKKGIKVYLDRKKTLIIKYFMGLNKHQGLDSIFIAVKLCKF